METERGVRACGLVTFALPPMHAVLFRQAFIWKQESYSGSKLLPCSPIRTQPVVHYKNVALRLSYPLGFFFL